MLTIKKIMYKPPATIVFWNDGTKTVSVCEEGDVYNKELGFALCVLKKKYDNKTVHQMLDTYVHGANEYSEKDKAVVWENKPKEKGFRKPNVVKKRIKLHTKPDRYIEFTLEPVAHEYEPEYYFDVLDRFFEDYMK
jgi:predicted Rdx family selenoprotein